MKRTIRRRLVRHALLAVGSSLATFVVFHGMAPDDPRFRLSMATAYVSLTLLVVTLLLGPLNVLRDRPNPVSTNLRRDVGIWAGIVGLCHVAVGLQVHLRGRMLEYFLFPPDGESLVPLRYDPFGLANWAGLAAALLILLLLVLSNDASLRRLGPRRWKNLQRFNYGVFALVAFHGVTYQLLEDRPWAWVLVFGLLVLAVVALQLRALRKRRTAGGPPRPDQD